MIAASATNLEATMLQNGGDSQQTYAKPKDETALAMSSPSLGSKSASVQPSSEDNFMCIEKPQQMTSNTALQAASRAGTSIATDISGHRRPCGRAQKVRGKFSDLRRQEVQNIRKQGACIRCRMLRKTVCLPRLFDYLITKQLILTIV